MVNKLKRTSLMQEPTWFILLHQTIMVELQCLPFFINYVYI